MQHSSLNLKFQATKWPKLSMQKDFLAQSTAFGAKRTPLIGVDISSTSVKLVELAGTRQNRTQSLHDRASAKEIRSPTATSPTWRRSGRQLSGRCASLVQHKATAAATSGPVWVITKRR